MKAKKPKTEELVVKIDAPKPRKRVLPRTAFKGPNEHSFKPGQSGNPRGKKKNENLLVSKALRVQLNNRAPDRVCEHLGLKNHASWAMCLAQRLLRVAVSGEMHSGGPGMQALEMLVRLTEPHGGKPAPGELAQAVLDGPSSIDVVFLSSDGSGRLTPADAAMIQNTATAFNARPSTIDASRPVLDAKERGADE